MSGDGDWELQRAVFAALSADAGLRALIGDPPRIYDDAPIDGAFPFLAIGQTRTVDWPGAEQGVEHELSLYAWSRYGGRKEIKEIMSAVYDVLHDGDLTLTTRRLINLRFVFGDVFRKQDGETFQGLMRYRAVTEPISA